MILDPRTMVSPKLVAAAAGAGAGSVISQVLIWVIGASLFNGGWGADQVDQAMAAVPTPLAAFVFLLITVGGAVIPGYATTDPTRQLTDAATGNAVVPEH